jgi:response regulator RpfG family c-di-GMP phosphodiesterase
MGIKKIEILIVEDAEENRIILEEICLGLGFKPNLAIHGKDALSLLEKLDPDLILLDIEMPEMDGFELLEELKKDPIRKNIPVLMVTVSDSTDDIVKCLKMGADDYITKPFEPEILKARMNTALNKLHMLQSEKDLLEKTFTGSIRLLSDILLKLNPDLFGKSAKVRKIANMIAKEMNYPEVWVIELSAMFSMIGAMALPEDIVNKVIVGKNLTLEEKKVFMNHTEFGYKIVNNIPRMQKVAEIIRFQNKNLDGTGTPEEIQVLPYQIPIGSKILRMAIEFEQVSNSVVNVDEILKSFMGKINHFDKSIVFALQSALNKQKEKGSIEIKVADLKEGMVIVQPIYSSNGAMVVGQWQEVTTTIIERINSLNKSIGVKEPISIIYSIT